MSFGSQTVGDTVVPKFDMHVYTFVLTSDEVKNLVAEYAIPLDLRPCVPPSGLTMNRLPVNKIGIYDHVADPPPTGVRAEDIRRLCKNIIDLRPVHLAMLYEIGLTTIWKHVGHHPIFKDGEGTVATSMSQFLKFLMSEGVCVGKGAALAANEVIPQHTTQPLPFGSHILEKSDRQKVVDGSGTHHSASPLTTIILDDVDPTVGRGSLVLESFRRKEDDVDRSLDNVDDDTHVHSGGGGLHHDKGDEHTHRHASGSFGHVVSSSSGGSGRLAFPKQNPGGDGTGLILFPG
ncbi:hypothetical protein Tco_0838216 [Tanacetum coccineum]|uniref:Uncharacterized protein n=1 Tax=Tanacetum coccineum TaxID=301880 RepID=A0ABQ5ANY2_9ASTR